MFEDIEFERIAYIQLTDNKLFESKNIDLTVNDIDFIEFGDITQKYFMGGGSQYLNVMKCCKNFYLRLSSVSSGLFENIQKMKNISSVAFYDSKKEIIERICVPFKDLDKDINDFQEAHVNDKGELEITIDPEITNADEKVKNEPDDKFLEMIVDDIKTKDKASISYIQRAYSVGFNKAFKVYQSLLEKGIIDENFNVLIKKEGGIKAIFLDVDGVLNCRTTKDKCEVYTGIEDEKVKLLKKIVDETGAMIVLTSSWKENWYSKPILKDKQDELANYLDKKLSEAGLKIADKIDDYDTFSRGNAILLYLKRQENRGIKISKFVILDDEALNYKESHLTKNLVQTSFENGGLQEKHMKKAITILNGDNKC